MRLYGASAVDFDGQHQVRIGEVETPSSDRIEPVFGEPAFFFPQLRRQRQFACRFTV